VNIILLHISDLHIKPSGFNKEIERIIASLRPYRDEIDSLFIPVSGDIAYSGSPEEYDTAQRFFLGLSGGLREEHKVPVEIILVPGNHDCWLSDEDDEFRKMLVDDLKKEIDHINNPKFLKNCVEAQESFFTFAREFNKDLDSLMKKRLCWQQKYKMKSGKGVSFCCINSAFVSKIKETQGSLVFPVSMLPSSVEGDINISILHHPYNWFEADNAREIRKKLESISDIILTGHEHDGASFYKKESGGFYTQYIEGEIFHDNDDQLKSGYFIIVVDTDKSLYQTIKYSWDGDKYSKGPKDSEWIPFNRIHAKTEKGYFIKDEMADFLKNPGAQLSHPKKTIELSDIYVPPNIKRIKRLLKGQGFSEEVIESEKTIGRIFNDNYLYFSGEGECGKTSLAKKIYLEALERDLKPLYLTGVNLNTVGESQLKKIITKLFNEQYRVPDKEAYLQLPKDERVLIIDDLNASKLNPKGIGNVCDWFADEFGYVFILGDDLSQVEELIVNNDATSSLGRYQIYEIMEFGYLLRAKLIEKWFLLGQEADCDREAMASRISQTESLVDAALGKRLVPPYPIYILVILQLIEAKIPHSTTSGTHGYYYEYLITEALNQTSKSPDDVDIKYNYLSNMAWQMFDSETKELPLEDLRRFNEKYWKKYRLSESSDKIIGEIKESKILVSYDDSIKFSYPYIFYYFIARYIRDNSGHKNIKDLINLFIEQVHREDYANILIFIAYLSRDKRIIYGLIRSAKKIFSDIEPCDLDSHIEFVNKLQEKLPEIVLPEGEAEDHKKDILRKKDEAEENDNKKGDDSLKESGQKKINEVLSLNRAFKTLQIMGQILKNFSGSLEGRIKADITKECFNLGLRSLNVLFSFFENDLAGVLEKLAEIIGKKSGSISPEEKMKRSKEMIFYFCELLSFGMIKRISHAVGSEKLVLTYEDIQVSSSSNAIEFVQTAIRLDHFRQFPEKKILALWGKVSKSVFGSTLLKLMVAEHFYLFPRPYSLRQSICDKLGISYKKQLLASTKVRRLE
jgi:predicted MPP superfamily phosphohydrolase